MRVVFMGTPEFAVPPLVALDEAFEVVQVVTRPDAVRSRGKKLEPSPVKAEATRRNLPVLETNRMTPEVIDALKALAPDIICVAAYGCILPDAVLEIAPLGCINVHASLLPRWRGAAPIQRAVLEGDEFAGASIMQVVHELDAGAYCAQVKTEVADKTSGELMAEIAQLGGAALVEAIHSIADGTAQWSEQDDTLVTYAHKIDKAEMRPNPAESALTNKRRIQASTDAQPARCTIAGKGMRVVKAVLCPDALPELSQGTVVVSHGRIFLGCADSAIEVLEVKPDGKRLMSARDFAAGLRGDTLTWELA